MASAGKSTYVLGTGLSHDGSACLLKNGVIRVAIEKERITRLKHDGANDDDAVSYCLAAEGIQLEDVAVVVQNANFSMFERGNRWFKGSRLIANHPRVVTISHHLAHAYSAIGTSPFDEATILVIDGCGNAYDESVDRAATPPALVPPVEAQHLYFEKDSCYTYKDNVLTPVYKDYSPWGLHFREYPMCPPTTLHSIGGMYSAASYYCLFGMDDPGKLMGLAPYGRSGQFTGEIFRLEGGRIFVDYGWMSGFDRPCRSYADFKANFQYYADIAYWVQREVERAILYLVDQRYEVAPSDNLATSGGVALNVVANRRILRETRFKNLYVQPAAGDNGLAIGCAYYGWLAVLQEQKVRHGDTTCFGRTYPRSAIDQALEPFLDRLERVETNDPVTATAELLASGQTVGWFQGGSEFGPRALGHRSILADPRNPGVKDHINSKIKFREDFRPFAPSVPLEDVSKYFDCDYASPHMLLVTPVRPEMRDVIPSVIHQDGSCRIQTVTLESDSMYYNLLRAFERITGISVLLNTSFNRRGMPIVETPGDAVDLFFKCGLDILVIENRVFRKKPSAPAERALDIGQFFRENLKETLERNLNEVQGMGGVYQIRINGPRSFIIDLSKAAPSVFEGVGIDPDVTVELDEGDFRRLLGGGANAAITLLEGGKLKVQGDFTRAVMLNRIFEMR